MRRLVHHATIATPNLTEAQLLLDEALTTSPLAIAEATQLLVRFATKFKLETAILTGIDCGDKIAVI
ncbi:pyridoxal kinase, partial [Enterococcus faecium]